MVCYWYCTEKWQVPQQHLYFPCYYSLGKGAWRAVLQHFLTIEFVTPWPDFLWSFGDSALSPLGKCWSVFHLNINLGWHNVVCNIATLCED